MDTYVLRTTYYAVKMYYSSTSLQPSFTREEIDSGFQGSAAWGEALEILEGCRCPPLQLNLIISYHIIAYHIIVISYTYRSYHHYIISFLHHRLYHAAGSADLWMVRLPIAPTTFVATKASMQDSVATCRHLILITLELLPPSLLGLLRRLLFLGYY